jgi:glucose-6-phosphate 1-epimerase
MNLAEQLQQLYQRFGDLPGISIELHKDLIAIAIDNQAASATVFLQGAQLSHYQPKGQQPVIWCSEHCDYAEGSPLRGGIPICWPWFGDFGKNPEQLRQQYPASLAATAPAHGPVRSQLWQLDEIDIIDPATTRLQLSLIVDQAPLHCRLQYQLTIAKSLDCQLTVHNLSQQAFSFSGALHSYLAISDCDDVQLEGLDNCPYIDALQDWSRQQQIGVVNIAGEVDRIYYPTQPTTELIDQGFQRRLRLTSRGSHSTVVWNPWIDKARRLSQFGDEDYRQMLCIETANALDDLITLAPSEHHELGLSLHCTTIND